jgi:hypothetical protein
MSDLSGKIKYSNFYLCFSKRTEKDLTQEKWLEVSGKSETLARGRLHYLEQLSYWALEPDRKGFQIKIKKNSPELEFELNSKEIWEFDQAMLVYQTP